MVRQKRLELFIFPMREKEILLFISTAILIVYARQYLQVNSRIEWFEIIWFSCFYSLEDALGVDAW